MTKIKSHIFFRSWKNCYFTKIFSGDCAADTVLKAYSLNRSVHILIDSVLCNFFMYNKFNNDFAIVSVAFCKGKKWYKLFKIFSCNPLKPSTKALQFKVHVTEKFLSPFYPKAKRKFYFYFYFRQVNSHPVQQSF